MPFCLKCFHNFVQPCTCPLFSFLLTHVSTEEWRSVESIRRDLRNCAACDKSPDQADTLKRCAKCKDILYCSRARQTANWKIHRNLCCAARSLTTNCLDASVPVNQFGLDRSSKLAQSRCMIYAKAELWFRGLAIDDRDRALLGAAPVNFVHYGQQSYLRKLVCSVSDT